MLFKNRLGDSGTSTDPEIPFNFDFFADNVSLYICRKNCKFPVCSVCLFLILFFTMYYRSVMAVNFSTAGLCVFADPLFLVIEMSDS